MKYSEKLLRRLNELLLINYEAKKIYMEAQGEDVNEDLKRFFRKRTYERHESVRFLSSETAKLNEKPYDLKLLNSRFHDFRENFKSLLKQNNENELLEDIYYLEKLSLDKFNAVLSEPGLSLSMCKALIKQRDITESSLNAIKRREDELVA
ncbi:DUF2383 domain-containing protein [Tamlana sp. 2201CG12-4]|uniref:DUF2383 domain-containing protein n=1 Tax=Tamlana sp. 2201CG12-4 TaxID=3112582 RepID=UPI002DB7A552|nr:DUF2383 domain-containing protein [Tamlana sp. 2201CG12-4]MEC3906655.1 DUF2383 domain-containing protein [Tamlana sp. 2201CG12-4]